MRLRFFHPAIIVAGIFSFLIQDCVDSNQASLPDVSLAELKAAPDTVTLSGRRYVLQTFLWRDFMPPAPPEGQPLIASISIVEIDSEAIPDDLDAPFVWVVYKDSIWATAVSCEQRPQSQPSILEKIARDGPKWGPDVEVDVIVGLKPGSGDCVLLRAPAQTIHATS